MWKHEYNKLALFYLWSKVQIMMLRIIRSDSIFHDIAEILLGYFKTYYESVDGPMSTNR